MGRDFGWKDGDDPVRRRELLAGAAGLASAAALGPPAPGRSHALASPRASLEEALYARTAATPVPAADLRAAVTQARADFQTTRYDRLARSLPGLIGAATAARQAASTGEQAAACILFAEACITAANFMVKLNDDPLALTLADRA